MQLYWLLLTCYDSNAQMFRTELMQSCLRASYRAMPGAGAMAFQNFWWWEETSQQDLLVLPHPTSKLLSSQPGLQCNGLLMELCAELPVSQFSQVGSHMLCAYEESLRMYPVR